LFGQTPVQRGQDKAPAQTTQPPPPSSVPPRTGSNLSLPLEIQLCDLFPGVSLVMNGSEIHIKMPLAQNTPKSTEQPASQKSK
jgi:hypothetical protein